jgi:hypothetical protein
MFIKESISRYKKKKYINASIVCGYRDENKKVKLKTIFNLGQVKDDSDREKNRRILEEIKQGETLIKIKDLNFQNQSDFGLIYCIKQVLKNNNFLKIIENIFGKKKNYVKLFFHLISNRLSNPKSDLEFTKWLQKHTFDRISTTEVYRFLTFLYEKKGMIEDMTFQYLKEKKFVKAKIVFIDLTSSYFESSISEIAKYGYSRDKRKDKKQIVIALVMMDNLPIASYVFEGNTQDKQTLEQIAEELKQRFGIAKCVVVADKGLLSNNNIILLNDHNFQYILAAKRRGLNQEEKIFFTKAEHLEEKNIDNKRYFVFVNNQRRKQELDRLDQIVLKINESLQTKKSIKTLCVQFGKSSRLINFETRKINQETLDYEKAIAGKYMVMTNTDLSPSEAIKQYKQLQEIERCFRELKSFVNVRPMWHRKKENIVSHVFICVFALLIKRLIEKQQKGCFESLTEIKAAKLEIKNQAYFLLNDVYQEKQLCFRKIGLVPLPKMIALDKVN